MPPERETKNPHWANEYARAIEPTAVTSQDNKEIVPTLARLAGSMIMPEPIILTATMMVRPTTPILVD